MKAPSDYSAEIHNEILTQLTECCSEYSYLGLYRKIKLIAVNVHIKMGTNKAKQFAKYYYNVTNQIDKKDNGLYIIKPL